MKSAAKAVVERAVIQNRSPVDLRPMPPVAISNEADVRATVTKSRAAQSAWAELGFEKRAKLMKRAGRLMLERRQELLDLLHDEAGKPPGEVLMGEALGALQFISDWIVVARPFLKEKRVPISMVAF